MGYEKPIEEQIRITRQSQLKLVLDWAESCDKCLTLIELVGITNVMTDYVMDGYSKQIRERLENIQDHIDNKGIPKKP
jgi:hypothetical protein